MRAGGVVTGAGTAGLARLLAIADGGTGDRRLCNGRPAVTVHDVNGEVIACWTPHHRTSLRGTGDCDADLRDGPAFTECPAGPGAVRPPRCRCRRPARRRTRPAARRGSRAPEPTGELPAPRCPSRDYRAHITRLKAEDAEFEERSARSERTIDELTGFRPRPRPVSPLGTRRSSDSAKPPPAPFGSAARRPEPPSSGHAASWCRTPDRIPALARQSRASPAIRSKPSRSARARRTGGGP